MSNSNPGKTLANRPFGLIFGGIFLIIALFPLLWGNELRWWAGWVSAGFVLVALIFPRLLTPLNKLWAKFGQVIHKIILDSAATALQDQTPKVILPDEIRGTNLICVPFFQEAA